MADTIEINSAEKFGELFFNWHQNRLALLKQFQSIPEGSEVTVNGIEIVLSGEFLKGFSAAMSAAYAVVEESPFVIE